MACWGYPPQDCPLTRWALPYIVVLKGHGINHCDFYSGIMLYPGRLRVPMTGWCVAVVDEKGPRAIW